MKLKLLPAKIRELIGRVRDDPAFGYRLRRRAFNFQRAHQHPALMRASRRAKLRRT